MKEFIEKINVNYLNKLLYFSQKILRLFYFLTIIILIYFSILICKEWKIIKFFFNILSLLSPLFLGIIISYILNPLIMKLENKMKRKYAVFIVYSIILIFLVILGIYIYPIFLEEINELIRSLPDVFSEINNIISNVFKKNYHINIQNIIEKYFKNNISFKLSSIILTLKNIISIIGVIILGLIISFYLSLNFDKTIKSLFNMLPINKKNKLKPLIKEIDSKVFSYIKGTFILSTIIFIFSSISFSIIKLKSAIFLGLFNGVTNIIPYIGPYIGAIPIILVAFTESKRVGIYALIIVILIQIIESYILHPLIMSKSMDLNPVTILISLVMFGYFFGIVGMIIAMPVVATIKTILLYFLEGKLKSTKININ